MEGGIVVVVLAAHFHARDRDFVYVALVNVRHELRKIDFFVFLPGAARFNHLPEQECREHNHYPENTVLTVEFT